MKEAKLGKTAGRRNQGKDESLLINRISSSNSNAHSHSHSHSRSYEQVLNADFPKDIQIKKTNYKKVIKN